VRLSLVAALAPGPDGLACGASLGDRSSFPLQIGPPPCVGGGHPSAGAGRIDPAQLDGGCDKAMAPAHGLPGGCRGRVAVAAWLWRCCWLGSLPRGCWTGRGSAVAGSRGLGGGVAGEAATRSQPPAVQRTGFAAATGHEQGERQARCSSIGARAGGHQLEAALMIARTGPGRPVLLAGSLAGFWRRLWFRFGCCRFWWSSALGVSELFLAVGRLAGLCVACCGGPGRQQGNRFLDWVSCLPCCFGSDAFTLAPASHTARRGRRTPRSTLLAPPGLPRSFKAGAAAATLLGMASKARSAPGQRHQEARRSFAWSERNPFHSHSSDLSALRARKTAPVCCTIDTPIRVVRPQQPGARSQPEGGLKARVFRLAGPPPFGGRESQLRLEVSPHPPTPRCRWGRTARAADKWPRLNSGSTPNALQALVFC